MAKKYIITEQPTGSIAAITEKLSVQDNGNWWLMEENIAFPNTFCAAYDANGQIADTTDPATIGKGIEVPEGIEPYKYCYTPEKGFFENPDYEEPESKPESAK